MRSSHPFFVTVLGSGTCTPMLERAFPGYVLSHASHRYLIDGGSGTLRRLVEVGVPPVTLDALFYTHIHLDHVGDLFPLLFSLTHGWAEARRSRDIEIFGPPGFEAFFFQACALFPGCLDDTAYQVHVQELGVDVRHTKLAGGVSVEAVRVEHPVPAVGYRFVDSGGQVVCFTGDTAPCPGLESLLRNADLAVAECSTPDALKLPGHLSPTPLGHACRNAGVKRVVLSHLYPPAEENTLINDIRRVFDGEVVLAEDGKRYAARDKH